MSEPIEQGLADYWLGLYLDEIINQTTKEN